MSERRENAYERFTPSMALGLMAPHTWPASILPCLIAFSLSVAGGTAPDPLIVVIVTAIAILMQSAVNTFNDYFDYVKGADSLSDNVEPGDAVLLYNRIAPHAALALAVGLLAGAFLIGIPVIMRVGFVPLAYAVAGAIAVVAYSGGKTPISYLPLGEAVSGFVMGMLILLAAHYCFTGRFDPLAIVFCLPEVIGIGLIMMTNNTCDIEKDIAASRKTLPVLLGRERAVILYRVLFAVMAVLIVGIIATAFTGGAITLVFAVPLCYPFSAVLARNPLLPSTRIQAMSQVLTVNVVFGISYAAGILASAF